MAGKRIAALLSLSSGWGGGGNGNNPIVTSWPDLNLSGLRIFRIGETLCAEEKVPKSGDSSSSLQQKSSQEETGQEAPPGPSHWPGR